MVNPKHNGLNRRDALIQLGLAVVVILLLNVVAQFGYKRFDLTSEKKYSISEPTKRMVRNLKDEVTVKIYLDGDLPAGFKRLKESTRNLLNEMRAYGGKNIQYEFIDPMAITAPEERKAMMKDLYSKGLSPTNLMTKENNENKQKIIFPGALVIYGGREMPVQLLENQIGYSPDEILNNSVISLEFKFANTIKKLLQSNSPRIAFLTGNEELTKLQTADIRQTLTTLEYQVEDFNLTSGYSIPYPHYDLAIVAKPLTAFDEKQKFKIDQFIMHGGKVLWLIDATNADMDSLRGSGGGQFVLDRNLNLDDLLFKYGVRLNTDLIQDINMCTSIPIVVGKMGNAPQTELFPWYYFPLLTATTKHAIVRNLDPVLAQFAGTIDTVGNSSIHKTILLHTSDNAKAVLTPTRVNFSILKNKPDPKYYNQQKLPVAVLLEGKFESVYKNRLSPAYLQATDTVKDLKFEANSPANRMIVIADGDLIRNDARNDSSAYPLGFYKFTKQSFANKDFLLNCIEYLLDDDGILETRNKDVKLRLLNTLKAEDEKTKWQFINIALPIALIVAFGFGYQAYRRKKYAR